MSGRRGYQRRPSMLSSYSHLITRHCSRCQTDDLEFAGAWSTHADMTRSDALARLQHANTHT